jgi:hypothetical protein
MTLRFRPLALAAAVAILTAGFAAGCSSSDGYSPRVYGAVSIGTGYYGGGYYGPMYGRPYPPYGGRLPGMRPPPSYGGPRPMNPVARPPSPGRMPSIPSMPRPAMRR